MMRDRPSFPLKALIFDMDGVLIDVSKSYPARAREEPPQRERSYGCTEPSEAGAGKRCAG